MASKEDLCKYILKCFKFKDYTHADYEMDEAFISKGISIRWTDNIYVDYFLLKNIINT